MGKHDLKFQNLKLYYYLRDSAVKAESFLLWWMPIGRCLGLPGRPGGLRLKHASRPAGWLGVPVALCSLYIE